MSQQVPSTVTDHNAPTTRVTAAPRQDGAPAAITAITPFGDQPLPAGVEPIGLDLPVGRLTAFRVRARDHGHSVPRGTVLIVPGFTGSKEDFTTFLPRLADAGWDVVAYSQRGQGDSVGPAGVENYRLADFASDTIAVADLIGAGEPVHLVGHSFGGCVARAAAIAAPDRFRSITLLCSGPHGWPGRHQETTDTVTAGGSIGLWYRDNPHTRGVADADLDPGMAFLRLRAERTSPDNLLAGAEILRTDPDTTDQLRATGLPALVAYGEFDDKWPLQMQHESALGLGAREVSILAGMHCPHLDGESPEATAIVLATFWGEAGDGSFVRAEPGTLAAGSAPSPDVTG
ncbi:MAG: alpha/beta fold hydrolase [Mycetocola sp.]